MLYPTSSINSGLIKRSLIPDWSGDRCTLIMIFSAPETLLLLVLPMVVFISGEDLKWKELSKKLFQILSKSM